LFEVRQFPGRNEGGDFFPESLADSREFPKAVGPNEIFEIRRGGLKSPGGGEVSPAFEGIFSLELQNRPNFPKGARGLILGHKMKLSTLPEKRQGKW
jgi:hypothetical protein